MIIPRPYKKSEPAKPVDATAEQMMIQSGGNLFLTFNAAGTNYALYIVATRAVMDTP